MLQFHGMGIQDYQINRQVIHAATAAGGCYLGWHNPPAEMVEPTCRLPHGLLLRMV